MLVVDLPPGTGDAPLTLVQQVPVTGGVIVTTPQDVALLDVGRGIAMFAQVATPVLGIVENMAGYTCPSCGTHDAIFGEGGGQRLAAAFDLPLLASIPLVPAVRDGRRRRPADRACGPAQPRQCGLLDAGAARSSTPQSPPGCRAAIGVAPA